MQDAMREGYLILGIHSMYGGLRINLLVRTCGLDAFLPSRISSHKSYDNLHEVEYLKR